MKTGIDGKRLKQASVEYQKQKNRLGKGTHKSSQNVSP